MARLVSLPQTKSKKPEISAPQAVCDEVSAGPPSQHIFQGSPALLGPSYQNRYQDWPRPARC